MFYLLMKRLGLLGVPLLVVAVFLVTLAWSHSTGPPVTLAADAITFDQVQDDVGISPVLDDTGGITTDTSTNGAVVIDTEDSITTSTALSTGGTIANGLDPGNNSAPAVVTETNQGNGIFNDVAAPVPRDGTSFSLMLVIAAGLIAIGTIAVFEIRTGRLSRYFRRHTGAGSGSIYRRRLVTNIAQAFADATISDPQGRTRRPTWTKPPTAAHQRTVTASTGA